MRKEILHELGRCLDEEYPAVVITVLNGSSVGRQICLGADGRTAGDLGSRELGSKARSLGHGARKSLRSNRVGVEVGGENFDLFIDVYPPRSRLVIVGAVHVAIPLVTFAAALGFHTVVVDPRASFATPERFAHADQTIVAWPDEAFRQLHLGEATFVAVLSHDLKIDLPALEIVLRSPVRYIGALGSKRTHAKRVAALKERGFTDDEIGRIHAPIGFDLGGRRAEEIALAVMAEIVATSHGVKRRSGAEA